MANFARRILAAYEALGLMKVADGERVAYNAPLFASVTSVVDTATSVWWPRARWGRLTEGHDPTLATHDFRKQTPPLGSPCLGIQGAPDFGQSWHCIHVPNLPKAATPSILIDLPARERRDQNDRDVEHDQYELAPQRGFLRGLVQWSGYFHGAQSGIVRYSPVLLHHARSRQQHRPEEERRIREAALDQTLEASFPASDPSSSNPNPDDHGAVDREVRPEATLEKTRVGFP